MNHEKAKSIHAAAKEMVQLAEQGLGEQSTLDTACQEMLSHAASNFNLFMFANLFRNRNVFLFYFHLFPLSELTMSNRSSEPISSWMHRSEECIENQRIKAGCC